MNKKMNEDEERELIYSACGLIKDAQKRLQEADKLFHKCGVKMCSTISFDSPFDDSVQLLSGIAKLEKIIGAKAYFRESYITSKPDKSRKYLDFNDMTFMQISEPTGNRYR